MPRNALRRLRACAGMTLLRTAILRETKPIREESEVWGLKCEVQNEASFWVTAATAVVLMGKMPMLRAPGGVTTNGASAPNKPNLGMGRKKDKCRVDNEL